MHNNFDFSQAFDFIDKAAHICIVGHVNPDGDALGAGLGLYLALKSIGKKVDVIMPNEFPDFLQWLPDTNKILLYSKQKKKIQSIFDKADLIISVDHNSPGRAGNLSPFITNSKARKILFDHHIQPDIASYDEIYQTENISSTSELIFHFLNAHKKIVINRDIASCIYTGIMTDTGSFSYACHTPDTYFIASKLQELGADIESIHQYVYFNYPENRMRLLGYSLSNKLVVRSEHKTAYIYLSLDELHRFNYQPGDTEGLVNWALSLEGVKFAALFKERLGKIRISFRSQGEFSVNTFAEKYFSGGGHKHAAGGDCKKTLKDTIAYFESLLPTLNIK
jgi:phosphoesterase RecJ-like protein